VCVVMELRVTGNAGLLVLLRCMRQHGFLRQGEPDPSTSRGCGVSLLFSIARSSFVVMAAR
jgi:hypothetical protein